MNFLAADVPDPTDFPPPADAPGLRALDRSFRCDICGDLYDAPATIACGHCFCSACIRSSLALKQECPSCRKTTNEAHIRPNPALESVISSWKEGRSFVLGLIKREKDRATPSSSADKHTAKKRKRSIDQSSSLDAFGASVAGPSRHAHVLSPRRADSASTTPKPHSRTKKLVPKSNSSADATTIPSSDIDEGEITPPRGAAPKEDALVKCPLCQRRIIYRLLNAHIDNNCKDPTVPSEHNNNNNTAKSSWQKIMSGGGETHSRNGIGQHKGKHKKRDSDSDDEHPLPLSGYTTLKDRQLKDMLTEQGLSVVGNRTIWEQRHQRWVLIFNANLDKSLPNRKTRAELKRDLKKWEDERGKSKKTLVRDTHQYQIDHKDEFARLIEQAKGTKVKQFSVKPQSETGNSHSLPLSSPPSIAHSAHSSAQQGNDVIVVDSEEERLSQRR
ncbi:hypothetical protein HYPSUDRAFT_827064 [Hypholoma sublateritium FD-334 SS-4]|uniref:Postreplication repair E3 ubiquitin-protein ligase RAD18 n=1 Tax=Hypholoma sublateritium (strain FD-334 SS-4) TaxID=945553 RepID=A0A0D2PJZ8_HYPSF|nr:hypothetical protein HYPSUDRAFT_827064 [Hypholoma sublateritium FD-334 SS-4]